MKNLITLYVLLLIPFWLTAQVQPSDTQAQGLNTFAFKPPTNCSPQTALLIA